MNQVLPGSGSYPTSLRAGARFTSDVSKKRRAVRKNEKERSAEKRAGSHENSASGSGCS